ncbi:MAG: NUDIX domain-containing protein [Lachnospiraceae bacterium]|nr:NUDIX domain-containing protein [Lachnospiraceae bacterium]
MKEPAALSTLCYMEKDGKYLMLHRTVKKNDVNKDKWIGVGGHFEAEESPEECLLREVREETGYTLTSWRFRGIVTFVSGDGVTEYMHLFTADGFEGEPVECDEGQLEWVDIAQVWKLNIWEGDKIFFRLIDEDEPFFSLKLTYDGKGCLVSAVLNGAPMELFDIIDEDGMKTGIVRERGVAHRDGSLHETVHTWIVRRKPDSRTAQTQNDLPSPHAREAGRDDSAGMLSGRDGAAGLPAGWEVLLQKRSACKDSNPGCYDISSAGHLASGDVPLEGAVRELREELGLVMDPEDLHYVGRHRGSFQAPFYGRMFRDNELSSVYVITREIEDAQLVLQEDEVESVRWMDYETCRRAIREGTLPNCIYADEFDMVGDYLCKLEKAEAPSGDLSPTL